MEHHLSFHHIQTKILLFTLKALLYEHKKCIAMIHQVRMTVLMFKTLKNINAHFYFRTIHRRGHLPTNYNTNTAAIRTKLVQCVVFVWIKTRGTRFLCI